MQSSKIKHYFISALSNNLHSQTRLNVHTVIIRQLNDTWKADHGIKFTFILNRKLPKLKSKNNHRFDLIFESSHLAQQGFWLQPTYIYVNEANAV